MISWGEAVDEISCAISPIEGPSTTASGSQVKAPLELSVHFWNKSPVDVFVNPASDITHIRETEQGEYLLGLRVEASRRQGRECNRVAKQTIKSFRTLATPLENLPDGEYRLVCSPQVDWDHDQF
jgi:hypothetical protein